MNAAILIVAAAVFFKRGIVVKEIQQAHELLTPLLGTTVAGVAFAVALLCSGQSVDAHRNPGGPDRYGGLSAISG